MTPYYKNELTTIYNGDCLEVMDYLIEQGIKVDAIITDPPYKSINGMQLKGQFEKVDWDNEFNWVSVWEKIQKITKVSSNVILFNSFPQALEMLKTSTKDIHHEVIWEKNNCAHGMTKDYMPLKYHENIFIYRNKLEFEDGIKEYHYKIYKSLNKTKKQIAEEIGKVQCGNMFLEVDGDGITLQKINEKDYNYFQSITNDKNIFMTYDRYNSKWKSAAVYNQDYNNFNKSIIKTTKDMTGLHPTQKPIALLQYLIKTYTKENDLILDFTAGSFTTCVAAEQLNRRSIGIELEKKYCDIGIKRLNNLQLKFDI